MKKHFIIIAAIAAATFSGTAQAQDFSAGPKAGVFFGDKAAVFYGAEINKSLNNCFTVGASIMVGEVETRHTATSTVLIPQEPITITPPPITVTPEPIKVDCNKPPVESKKMVTLCDQVKPCGSVIVQPADIIVQPDDIIYQPDPKKETRKRTVKRQADVVIAMLHGKYKLTGPLSVKGAAGVASIEGDKSLSLSGGVSIDLPVSDKLTAGLSAEYMRIADDVDGAMLTASVQYRF